MTDFLNSLVSSLGAIFSGIVQLSVWILALQGLFLGLMVLFYGKRSFWVFASVVGFVLGMWLSSGLSANLPAWVQLLLGLALGIAGAALGFFAPRYVATLIGSVALALFGVALAHSWEAATWLQWLIAIAFGFVGFYVFWRLLDWALIVGSSLLGAILVSISLNNLFDFTRGLGVLPFLVFLVAGIVYQVNDRKMVAELKRLRSNASPGSQTQTSASSEATIATEPSVDVPPLAPAVPASDAGATIQQIEVVTE